MQIVTIEKRKKKRIFKDEYSLFVSVPKYDPYFVSVMKALPLRFYDEISRAWEVPLSMLDVLKRHFKNHRLVGLEAEEARGKKDEQSIEEYLQYLQNLKPEVEYEYKTKPDGIQIEFFNKMLHRDKIILADPQGMGKTKETLDVCEYRKVAFGYQKIIFVCKDKHKLNMAKECVKHTNSRYIVVTGLKNKRLKAIQEFFADPDIYYLIIGYEAGKIFKDELIQAARKAGGVDGILLDEYTKIINPGTKKRPVKLTQAWMEIVRILNPELLVFMSGTPITKKPQNAWVPLYLMKEIKDTYWKFSQRFCLFDDWGRIIGTKNLDQLHAVLKDCMIRRPKELLRLKPKVPINYPVEMGPEQKSFYNAIVRGIREELEGTKVSGGVQDLAKLTRLRQVTTNPALLDSDAPSIKHEILLDLLEQIIDDQGEYAIVTSQFKEETRILKDLLKRYNPCYIDGDTKDTVAQEEVDKFQENPEHKVFIGSLGSIKESYTLTKAKYVIFLDLSWVVTDNEQLEDRAWRRGQENDVIIYRLICEGTIDEKVLDILASDYHMITHIIEGKPSQQDIKNFFDLIQEVA